MWAPTESALLYSPSQPSIYRLRRLNTDCFGSRIRFHLEGSSIESCSLVRLCYSVFDHVPFLHPLETNCLSQPVEHAGRC